MTKRIGWIIQSAALLALVAGALTGCQRSSGSGGLPRGTVGPGFTTLPATMSVGRAKLTATALPDGKILIAGGYRTSPFVSHASAEIFDPVARTFASTGDMTVRRQCHTATALPDGRVLIVGGNNELDESYNTAEIYDPATGKFTATGSMKEKRTCAMATLLPNGKVLVAGGYDYLGGPIYSDTAEIYDPATGTFSAPTKMNHKRSCHVQILLANGLVLLTTGCTATEYAELFDPRTNTFKSIGQLSTQRKYPFFARLGDGRVLIAGGAASGDDVNSAEIYAPSYSGGNGTFTLLANRLATGRWRGCAARLPDGKVLLLGGSTSPGGGGTVYLDSAELFDPLTETFSGPYKMSVARAKWPCFLVTQSGYGVIFGGIDAAGEATNTCEAWQTVNALARGFGAAPITMNASRAKLTATALPDGKILVAGGYRTSPFVSHDSAEVFDPVTSTTRPTGSMTVRRQCHTATALPDGKILVVGGNNELDESYNTAEIYDPATEKFTATGSMKEKRTCAMATLLPNGKVLVAGGYDYINGPVYSDTAEIYDPATGTFGAPIKMNYKRSCHVQVLLRNGLVLLTTGCTSTEYAELFDYRTGKFVAIGTLSTQRKYPFFALLGDGRVLIAGGAANGDDVDTAEIYTPSYTGGTGTFERLTHTLDTGRWRGSMGLLPGGKVLVLGGSTLPPSSSTVHLDTAELFDPVSGTFSPGYLMSAARAQWPRFVVTAYGYGVVFGGIGRDGEAVKSGDTWSTQ